MNDTQKPLETARLRIVFGSREETRKAIEAMQPHERAAMSPAWIALLESSSLIDPWIHGFTLIHRVTNAVVGQCGFKGPPDPEGAVELAYGIASEYQGQGYATEAAQALTQYALSHEQVRVVRAHTLPEANASGRVLTKCGFRRVGEVMDPDDGLVWRYEYPRPQTKA